MKRSLAWLLAALLVCSAPVFATPVCGDANDDTQVNILDALAIARHAAGTGILTPGQRLQSDVNSDSNVDVLDGLLVAQSSAGIAVALSCPPLGGITGTLGTSPIPVAPPAPPKLYALEGYTGIIQVLDLASGSSLGTINTGSAVGLAADPVRDLLYVSSGGGLVHVIDTTTDTITSDIVVPGLMGSIEVTPDGTGLVGISTSGIVVVDLPARTLRHSIATGGAGFGSGYVSVSPDSSSAWRSDDFGNTVTRVDILAGTVVTSVPVGGGPYGLDVSATGDMVFVINHYDQTLSRIDTATNLEILPRQPVGIYPMTVLGHSSGSAFAVNCISANISEHDAATGQQQGVFPVGQEPIDIAEVDGGDIAVLNSFSAWVTVIDPVTGTSRNITLTSTAMDIASK